VYRVRHAGPGHRTAARSLIAAHGDLAVAVAERAAAKVQRLGMLDKMR
jgi:hypothetical protein